MLRQQPRLFRGDLVFPEPILGFENVFMSGRGFWPRPAGSQIVYATWAEYSDPAPA
jgi:hypothetical protein